MAYPGSQGYYPAEQTSGWSPSGSYSQWSSEPETGGKVSHRTLTLAVALLGACCYLVSFGPVLNTVGIDWNVRFAVLAGLLAAFGLLPRQSVATKIVAALSGLGFLDALSRVIVVPEGTEPTWAMWVLVVLTGLQTGFAIAAVLAQPSASDEQQAWYAAYAEQYAQAAAQYYGQYEQGEQPEVGYESGTAHAQQTLQASEHRRAAAPQQASYAEFVGEHPAAPTGHQPSEAHTGQPSTGLPNVGHTQAPAAQQPTTTVEPEHRISPAP